MRFDVRRLLVPLLTVAAMAACSSSDDGMGPDMPTPLDPAAAPRATIDRFSDAAATLFKRSGNASMPAAGAAIDFDQAPFITQGLGPDGAPVRYYNFDVMSAQPAPIFVLFREGSSTPVSGQINIVDVIPGDAGYNDFWQVNKVTVPADYVANTVTSAQAVVDGGYAVQATDMIVNCPIVPEGSTASEGPGAAGLTMGWYKDQVVFYFDFNEASLTATPSGAVPSSDIFVAFNVNPDQAGGGPRVGLHGAGQLHADAQRGRDGSRRYGLLAAVGRDAVRQRGLRRRARPAQRDGRRQLRARRHGELPDRLRRPGARKRGDRRRGRGRPLQRRRGAPLHAQRQRRPPWRGRGDRLRPGAVHLAGPRARRAGRALLQLRRPAHRARADLRALLRER